MSQHTFIVMWDCTGLETIIDVTEQEQKRTWAALQGEKSTNIVAHIGMLELRARYNSQRHYEIYIISATEGITAEDIRGMFEADPQCAADTIRRIGDQYYSDRYQPSKNAII